jgi:tRNA nucleotidyltransferase/poly(A) polymerase
MATIRQIAEEFARHDNQFYEVGGSVRDSILKRECTDLDFTTDAYRHGN